jgi:hypothetical protein
MTTTSSIVTTSSLSSESENLTSSMVRLTNTTDEIRHDNGAEDGEEDVEAVGKHTCSHQQGKSSKVSRCFGNTLCMAPNLLCFKVWLCFYLFLLVYI